MVLSDDHHLSPAHLSDLNMLVMTGGQERTAREYGALLAQAGFRLARLTQNCADNARSQPYCCHLGYV